MKYLSFANVLMIRRVFAVNLLLFTLICVGCSGGNNSPAPTVPGPVSSGGLQISSLSETAAKPFDLLTISGSGFDSSAMISFSALPIGFSAEIQPVVLSQTSLIVSVPVLFSGANFSNGTANVTVIQSSSQSNSMQLSIAAVPPAPRNTPGTVSLGFLEAELAIANQLSAKATPAPLPSDLAALISTLNAMIPPIQAVVNGTSPSANLGSLNGQPVILGATELARMDQLFLALLQSLANSSSNGFSSGAASINTVHKATAPILTADCISPSAVEKSIFDVASSQAGTARNVAAEVMYLNQATSPEATKLLIDELALAPPALLLGFHTGVLVSVGDIVVVAETIANLADVLKVEQYILNPKKTGPDKAAQLSILISHLGLTGEIAAFGVAVSDIQRDYQSLQQGVPPEPQSSACVSALFLDFGAVNITTTSDPKPVKLTNNGPVSLTVTLPLFVGGPDPTDFHQTNDCPSTLVASQSCTITATLSPSKSTENAAIGVLGTSPALPIVIDLAGTGNVVAISTSVTPTTAALGTLNFCAGGQLSQTYQVVAPVGVPWSARIDGTPNPSGFGINSVSPSTGSGPGSFSATVTSQANGGTCQTTTPMSGTITIFFSTGNPANDTIVVTAKWNLVT